MSAVLPDTVPASQEEDPRKTEGFAHRDYSCSSKRQKFSLKPHSKIWPKSVTWPPQAKEMEITKREVDQSQFISGTGWQSVLSERKRSQLPPEQAEVPLAG